MIRKKAKKRGKLIDHGVRLMPHEAMTMEFFLDEGNDIELVIPSNTMKNKSADWLLWGKIWEVKSPRTSNTNTLAVMLKRAAKQSENLIVDLRGVKGDEFRVIKIIQRKFTMSKRLKNLLIITKDKEILKWKKG